MVEMLVFFFVTRTKLCAINSMITEPCIGQTHLKLDRFLQKVPVKRAREEEESGLRKNYCGRELQLSN